MRKNIVYLNNYMTDYIVTKRKNKKTFSQAANNKVIGICKSLISTGNKVTILSTGLVNNKTGRIYPKVKENIDGQNVIYCPIWDLPIINTLSSIFFTYREIKRQNKKNKIDNIIFYNYKPEVAWSAWLAKKTLHIPITAELEDGYSEVGSIHGIKRKLFTITETFVKKRIDSSILVNSELCSSCSVPNTVVRGVVNEDLWERAKVFAKSERSVPKLLFSGTLDEVRGIHVLLQALKYTNSNFILEISGRDDSGISELCSDSRVSYMGFLPYEELQDRMLDADIMLQCQLVSSSFSQYSFPSKLFEYISCNNLIISSALPDVVHFARDSFYIYDKDSPQELARVIDRAIGEWKNTERKRRIASLYYENRPVMVGQRIEKIL